MFDVLFHRHYRRFSGGHLKVWDYFQHVEHSRGFVPQIYFDPASVWDDTNPWLGIRERALSRWAPEDADVLFLGGVDWHALPEAERRWFRRPIVNLIQGIRHTDRTLPLYQFLGNRAVRVCVSQEVTQAVLATGKVNGPVFTVPNGIDLESLPAPSHARDIDVLIAGAKNPAMARQVTERLGALRVRCLTAMVPRPEFLAALSRSEIVVLLPHETEGFYLPALEGMALGALVICPACVGNRSFCLDGVNCLRPPYGLEQLLDAVRTASSFDETRKRALVARAAQTSREHDLRKERSMFLDILENVFDLWRADTGALS